MNTNSMPTPEPESNGNRGEAKTPEQKTVAYRLGRAVQLGVFPILGLGIFMAILSFVAHRLFDQVNADLIVVGTLACVWFIGLAALVWWCRDCIKRYFKRKPTEAPASTLQKGLPFWGDWKTLVVAWILITVVTRCTPHGGPINPLPDTTSKGQQTQRFVAGQQARARRLQATMSYWQTAVVNLHQIRFQIPSGDEPAGEFSDDMFNSLRKLTDRARAASTTVVDQDLVAMARRHLDIEDRMIQIKVDVDEMMKRDKIPADTVAVGQRITEWQNIVARIQADPSMLDNLPHGQERTLLENVLELEQQRLDQLREIEIMQAVLKERYPGTKFLLPEVAQ